MVETSIPTSGSGSGSGSSSTDSGLSHAPRVLAGVDFGEATDVGRVRRANEDACASAPEIGFFVVADGVAATRGADVAARIATASMVAFLRRQVAACSPPLCFDGAALSQRDLDLRISLLCAAAANAHQMICNHGIKHRCWGAATTMAALWLAGDRVIVAHAGDSRAYRLRNNSVSPVALEPLTKDDTALQEYTDQFGPPSAKTARDLGHIVTRVLGGKDLRDPEITLKVFARRGAEPESYLLCTDGLHGIATGYGAAGRAAVPEPHRSPEVEIGMLVGCASSAQTAANALIELANTNGGGDNVTAIVVRIREPPGREAPASPKQ